MSSLPELLPDPMVLITYHSFSVCQLGTDPFHLRDVWCVRNAGLSHDQAYTGGCCGVLVVALVVYEYFITVDDEVRTVWKRKFNFSSCFLLSVQWTMIASATIAALPSIPSVRLALCDRNRSR